jgi:carbamoyltransferase
MNETARPLCYSAGDRQEPRVRRILGISAYYHDAAAALVVDGDVVAAAQEERFTRRRHDPAFPAQAARWCLESAGLALADLDAVIFYDKPFLKFERLLETYLACAPHGLRSFVAAMPVWIKEKMLLKTELRRELRALAVDGGPAPKLLFSEHHLSHAASAFYPSPFERAAVLCLDGVGEWATASAWVGDGTRLEPRWELHFPHSLGLLYSAFTAYTGFRVNSGEYKMMGLAPYGEPRYADLIRRHLVDVKPDGTFRLDMRYFGYATGLRMTSERFHALFGGPPRAPDAPVDQRTMDLAASIQQVTDDIVLRLARTLRMETGERQLCLAGGVALNCVSNGLLAREGVFDDCGSSPRPAMRAAPSAPRWSHGTNRVVSGGRRTVTTGCPAPTSDPRGRTSRSSASVANRRCRTSASRRRRWPSGSQRGSPRAPWSAGCRGGWSSGRARSAIARSWPTRATRPCSAR